MKITLHLLLVIVLLGLTACQVPTSVPTGTPTADDSTLKTLPVPSPSAAPATAEPKPLPTLSPTLTPCCESARRTLPPTAADCQAFLGWPGCRTVKLPLGGLLAWVDSSSGVLTGANFANGGLWNAPTTGVTHLAWSPDKAKLLVAEKEAAAVYPAAGVKPEGVINQSAQGWLPDGLLLPEGWVGNPQSATAHIEVKDGLPYLKLRPGGASSVETGFPIAPEPSDRIYRLLAWLPGTDLLLGQAYFAGNAAWVTGGQLFTLDVQTRALKMLEAYALPGTPVALHPTRPGLLALAESATGGKRLAVLDALTGTLTPLTTDESVWASRPAWTNDGMALLFAAWAVPLDAPAGAPFDLRAIYLTSPQGGPLVRLTQPPAGFMDDQPRPLADGKHFLFVRRPLAGGSAELHLGGLDGITDEIVVKGMLLPACTPQPGCSAPVWDYVE